ncbi:MAG: OmpH family outer membrane protein [Acidobacteriota bacterium]
MNKQLLKTPALALGLVSLAYGQAQPAKVGITNFRAAIVNTRDGQKAFEELQNRFDPRRKELEKKQGEIAALQEKLRQGANTLSEEVRQKLMRDIDARTRTLNRDTEDAQSEFDQEQQKVFEELGGRMIQVIDKYARDNVYTLVLDVSSLPQLAVLYAANGIDITKDIVDLYDRNAPPAAPPGAARPSSSPASRPTAPVIKPATPAPKPGTIK